MFYLSAQAQEPTPPAAVGEARLHPLSITIGGDHDAPSSATAQELAVQSIELQIEQQRATEAASAELPGLWRASFWKYLPRSTGGTLNSPIAGDDDPVLTPGYLMLSARLLEREVNASDKVTKLLFIK
ncbi:MAG: hypothetical protein ABI362_04700 [Chthoniobacterales bacterium]